MSETKPTREDVERWASMSSDGAYVVNQLARLARAYLAQMDELERLREEQDGLTALRTCQDEQDDGNGPCGACLQCLRARVAKLEKVREAVLRADGHTQTTHRLAGLIRAARLADCEPEPGTEGGR